MIILQIFNFPSLTEVVQLSALLVFDDSIPFSLITTFYHVISEYLKPFRNEANGRYAGRSVGRFELRNANCAPEKSRTEREESRWWSVAIAEKHEEAAKVINRLEFRHDATQFTSHFQFSSIFRIFLAKAIAIYLFFSFKRSHLDYCQT